jgi:hypothetical protein
MLTEKLQHETVRLVASGQGGGLRCLLGWHDWLAVHYVRAGRPGWRTRRCRRCRRIESREG